jgi:hypothetical protein
MRNSANNEERWGKMWKNDEIKENKNATKAGHGGLLTPQPPLITTSPPKPSTFSNREVLTGFHAPHQRWRPSTHDAAISCNELKSRSSLRAPIDSVLQLSSHHHE